MHLMCLLEEDTHQELIKPHTRVDRKRLAKVRLDFFFSDGLFQRQKQQRGHTQAGRWEENCVVPGQLSARSFIKPEPFTVVQAAKEMSHD